MPSHLSAVPKTREAAIAHPIREEDFNAELSRIPAPGTQTLRTMPRGASHASFNNLHWPANGGRVTQLCSQPWDGATALFFDFRLQRHLDICLEPQDELLLTFFLTGEVTGRVGGPAPRTLDFKPDRALLRTPNRSGGYLIHVPAACRNVFVQFRLKRRLLPQWLRGLDVRLTSRLLERILHLDNGTVLCNAALTARVRACLARIQAEDAQHPAFVPLFSARATELLTYVMLDLGELLRPGRSRPSYPTQAADTADKVRAMMAEDPSRAWSVPELAAQAGCSDAQLQQAFRDATGSTVHQALRELRLDLAARLLRETDMPVQQVAGEAGWECHGRFGAAFRARHGVAPSNFRRGQRLQ
jgi:AraC-like DNA-binding protein